ncbi:hypothetical protein ACOMHN_048102 [Nucella lapillus]
MLRLVVLFVAVACANAFVCLPDACNGVQCAAMTAENCLGGTIMKNGGYCGCCDVCVHPLAEGDKCYSSLLLGVPSQVQCGEGLVCDPHTITCQKARGVNRRQRQTCAERVTAIEAAKSNGMPLLGQFIPTCETDGSYFARQCHGSVCYCVDPQGVQISGYQSPISQAANMDCQCARDQSAYMKTRLIGKLFFCTASGSYQRYDCTGSVCYCVDNLGAQKAGSQTVNIADIGSLQC